MSLRHRSRYRGNDPIVERGHLALCTWADEIRDRRPGVIGALGTMDRGARPSIEVSDLAASVDRIICTAPKPIKVTLSGYYRFGVPIEGIMRTLHLRISKTTMRERLDQYRVWTAEQLSDCGF